MNLADIELRRIESAQDAEDFLNWLGNRREYLGLDTETTGLNVGCDVIRLAQFGDHTTGWAIDWHWKNLIEHALNMYSGPIAIQNALFDLKFLAREGIRIPKHQVHDSMIMAHLNDPVSTASLKPVAVRHLDPRADVGKSFLEDAMKRFSWTWETVPTDFPAYWIYSALDACLTSLVASKLRPRTPDQPYALEMEVIHCLVEAELAGLRVDEEYRIRAQGKLAMEIDELQQEISAAIPDPEFNPSSDKQVREYLQGVGARLVVRTESGALSVDKDVLASLAEEFPIAGVLGSYRSKTRLMTAYIEKFADVSLGGLAVDGMLRASTRPVGARTGRMSITEPPLQTLPRGRIVRDAIIAHEGHEFVMADFSGMEMRALACLAKEKRMLEVFNSGGDVHDFTAETLYGKNFTAQQRTVCKNGNFGKIYGAGEAKFAVTAKISLESAHEFLERYNQMFPRVGEFMADVVETVRERAAGRKMGYVTLQDGRRLPVEKDKAYKGVNFRIQGGCAVTMKRKIDHLCNTCGLLEYFRLPVHDELLFEVPDSEVADVRATLEREMPDRDDWPGVTLEVESDVVDRWGEHYRGDFEPYIEMREGAWT